MADYNKTINLPKTDFPMRAKLAQREPGMLEEMNRKDLYRKVMERNKDKTPPRWPSLCQRGYSHWHRHE